MAERKDNLSLGELFGELAAELRTLLRQETELAKAEISQKISRLAKDLAALGAGGVIAYTGVLVLIAALVLGIGTLIPLWVSALIVGIVITAVGLVLIQKGRKDFQEAGFTPERTTETIKETAKWAKSQMK